MCGLKTPVGFALSIHMMCMWCVHLCVDVYVHCAHVCTVPEIDCSYQVRCRQLSCTPPLVHVAEAP